MASPDTETNPRNPLIKVETSVHHPPGTPLVAHTDAGPIFMIPLTELANKPTIIDDVILELTANNTKRKKLTSSLHLNSQIGPDQIGRPNSAFVTCNNGGMFIYHLLEDRSHTRTDSPQIHDFIRQYFEDQKLDFTSLGKNTSVLSGHLTALTTSTKNTDYIISLDKFQGNDAYRHMSDRERIVMDSLLANRVAPLTAKCHPISTALII